MLEEACWWWLWNRRLGRRREWMNHISDDVFDAALSPRKSHARGVAVEDKPDGATNTSGGPPKLYGTSLNKKPQDSNAHEYKRIHTAELYIVRTLAKTPLVARINTRLSATKPGSGSYRKSMMRTPAKHLRGGEIDTFSLECCSHEELRTRSPRPCTSGSCDQSMLFCDLTRKLSGVPLILLISNYCCLGQCF